MEIIKEETVENYFFSTDRKKLNIPFLHLFLSTESYWAKHIPFEVVEKSIENSLSIGVYFNDQQVGFARVITDYATFGYLADVFILETHRGKGLSKQLMRFIFELDVMHGLRRVLLATKDAHGLYRSFNFQELKRPDLFMEINQPNIYERN